MGISYLLKAGVDECRHDGRDVSRSAGGRRSGRIHNEEVVAVFGGDGPVKVGEEDVRARLVLFEKLGNGDHGRTRRV